MVISAIELTTPVIENNLTLTHWKICNWKFEVPRLELNEDKQGYIVIYIAKCFVNIDGYLEEPMIKGEIITITETQFDELINVLTTVQGLMKDFMDVVSQFMIDNNIVDGTLVVV